MEAELKSELFNLERTVILTVGFQEKVWNLVSLKKKYLWAIFSILTYF